MQEPNFEIDKNHVPFAAGIVKFGEEDGLAGSFERIFDNLAGHLETMIDQRPLDALALSLVLQAAGNIRTASRMAERVRRENFESARRRASLERFRAADALQRKLEEAPGTALAEARFSPEGCRSVIALWRSLGESLEAAEGWSANDLSLARALTGSAGPAFRTTRDRVHLERALNRDRRRPLSDLVATVDRVMNSYVDRLADVLERLAPDQPTLHEIVIETVQERAYELSQMIGAEDREAIASYRDSIRARNAGRARWESLRAFVAGQILAWKAQRDRLTTGSDRDEPGTGPESLGTAEMRKAEWARKNLSAAIADFQKTLALGKSIGLPDVICPKPAKKAASEKSVSNVMEDAVDRYLCSTRDGLEPVRKAATKPDSKTLTDRPAVQSYAGEAIRSKQADIRTTQYRDAERSRSSGRCSLPRDAWGRFLPGSAVVQPREANGRFRPRGVQEKSACSSDRDAPATDRRTTSQPLRATAAGHDLLRAIVPNVRGRESHTGNGDAAKPLADSAENVQNGDRKRRSGEDLERESRSDLPPDAKPGHAGDDPR